MVATHLAPVIAALLAGSGIVHGSCFIDPDENGHVDFPEQTTIINKNAFKGCTELKTINIPPTVVFINDSAFRKSGLNLLELTAGRKEEAAKCAEREVELKEKVSALEKRIAELEAHGGETCDTPCTSTALVKILPPVNGRYGTSIAVAGDTLVVGKPNERGNSGADYGAAYVFFRQTSGTWVMKQQIVALDRVPNGYFANDIAFDGNTLLIGSHGIGDDTGAAYIFTLQAGQWVETQKLTAADKAKQARFGTSVAVHGDTLVVGANPHYHARSSGSAYIFSLEDGENENRTWKQSAKVVALDKAEWDDFGHSVAVSPGLVAVGAPGHDFGVGAVYVYKLDTLGSWTQAHKLRPSEVEANARFGLSVAVSDDGTVVVGAPGSGSVYVFSCTAADDCMETNVLGIQSRVDNHYFGSSVVMSCDTIVVGASYDDNAGQRSGSVYTFTRQLGGGWVETNKIVPMPGVMGDNFGVRVAVSRHTVAAGASNGLAYVKEVCD